MQTRHPHTRTLVTPLHRAPRAPEPIPTVLHVVRREIDGDRDVLLQRSFASFAGPPLATLRMVGSGTLTAGLGALWVEEQVRRRGLGRELMLDALAVARHAGSETVALNVRVENRGAVALYRSLGFGELGSPDGGVLRMRVELARLRPDVEAAMLGIEIPSPVELALRELSPTAFAREYLADPTARGVPAFEGQPEHGDVDAQGDVLPIPLVR